MPEPLPSQRPPSNSKKAPRPLRLKSEQVATSLPPGAAALFDSLVGSFYGSSRAEVLRFALVSWITEHYATVSTVGKKAE